MMTKINVEYNLLQLAKCVFWEPQTCVMKPPLCELSGSALRKLALVEVKRFIDLIDNGTTEELQHKKACLTEIFARLSVKEQEELQHLMSLASAIAPLTLQKSA